MICKKLDAQTLQLPSLHLLQMVLVCKLLQTTFCVRLEIQNVTPGMLTDDNCHVLFCKGLSKSGGGCQVVQLP